MSAGAAELLDLIARWIHVIAGIMWVGNSMLFNFLDRNLRPRKETGSYGDIWLLHSGAFYQMEKVRGERVDGKLALPAPLHWFKWQAYTTWMTGALLLFVVYYAGGRALLEDPTVLAMDHKEAVVKAAGMLVLGWFFYEAIFRLLGERAPVVAATLGAVLLIASVAFYTKHFSGRAAFIHIGAMLATMMAGNVAFTIMPSQRELVLALEQGREPSQAIADRAKTRSIHNNYITFPVIAFMVSAHFPALYSGRPLAAALTLIVGGGLVRHWMNVRFTSPAWRWALPASVVATVAALVYVTTPIAAASSTVLPEIQGQVAFEDVRRIIDRRCAACHSAAPSDVSLGRTPAGVMFDTPEQIVAMAARIKERAIVQRSMPPGNKTMITDVERAMLARWIESGAALR